MSISVTVKNVKCGGCASAIKKAVEAIAGVNGVEVDVASGVVTIDAEDTLRAAVVDAMTAAGYPEA